MGGMIHALKRLFGGEEAAHGTMRAARRPKQQILPPEEHLANAEQNIRAMTSMLDEAASNAIILNDTLTVNGRRTAVEIRADKIHLTDEATHDSRLVRLDESLDAYQLLDEELRVQLGRRIARLVPELAASKKTLVLDHTVRLLTRIAQDQTERVRMMVAEELCDLPDAPYEVVRQLAFDASQRVAMPILEFSPLLRDEDLIELISTSPVPGVAEAVARRHRVSETVSEAVVRSGQPAAIHELLGNDGAQIGQKSMHSIIEMAPEHEIWHENLAHRPELTQKTINRIARFMSQDLLANLADAGAISQKHKRHSRAAVHHRLNSWTEDQERQAELRVRELHEMGRLSAERIDEWIHEVNEPFVIAALATKARMSREKVKKILRSDSARAVTALAWEAGLEMRTAMALQMKIGRIHHTKMLMARGGFDYPLSSADMEMYLDIFSG